MNDKIKKHLKQIKKVWNNIVKMKPEKSILTKREGGKAMSRLFKGLFVALIVLSFTLQGAGLNAYAYAANRYHADNTLRPVMSSLALSGMTSDFSGNAKSSAAGIQPPTKYGQVLFYNIPKDMNRGALGSFYRKVLEDAGKKIAEEKRGFEIEMAGMDRFMGSLVYNENIDNVDGLNVEKLYQGQDRFFQMAYTIDGQELLLTFKRSKNPVCRGYSAIVQPRKRVIVNGYGTIGKKAGDAFRKSGFEIIGVTNTASIGKRERAKHLTYDAMYKGYPLYVAPGCEDNLESAIKAGLPYKGTLVDLLDKLRAEGNKVIVVDASTGGKGKKDKRTGWINKYSIYEPYKDVIEIAIYQGGENPEVADASFSSASEDYDRLLGLKHVQVVSCNTTGLNRNYTGIKQALEDAGLRNVIFIDNNALRREKDPGAVKAGAVDEIQIDASNKAVSIDVKEFLGGMGVNIDFTITSAKGLYVQLATLKGTTKKEIEPLLLGNRQGAINIVNDKNEKFATSKLHDIVSEPDKAKNTMVVNIMSSNIDDEVKVVFGYSEMLEVPAGEEDAGTYGIKALFEPLKGKDYIRLDVLTLKPGSDWGGQLGGISVAPNYHHWEDLLETLSEEHKTGIKGNTPASMVPSTHYHVHIATVRAEGLTADMVIEAFKKQPRIAVVDFPKGLFSSSMLFEVVNSSIGEEVQGGSHPMVIIAQVKPSQIEGEVKIVYAVPQESDVIPENVNAVQAALGLFNKGESIRIVNEVLSLDRIKKGIEARLPVSSVIENLAKDLAETSESANIAEEGQMTAAQAEAKLRSFASDLAISMHEANLNEERDNLPEQPGSEKSGDTTKTSSTGMKLAGDELDRIKIAAEAANLSDAKGTIAYNDTGLSREQQIILQDLIGTDTQALAELEAKLGCKVRLLSQGGVEDTADTIIISTERLSGFNNVRYFITNQHQIDTSYIAIASFIPIAKGLLGLSDITQQPELYAALKGAISHLSQGLLNEQAIEEAITAYLNGKPMFIILPPAASYDYEELEELQRRALLALIAA